jgi:hypothetical protein
MEVTDEQVERSKQEHEGWIETLAKIMHDASQAYWKGQGMFRPDAFWYEAGLLIRDEFRAMARAVAEAEQAGEVERLRERIVLLERAIVEHHASHLLQNVVPGTQCPACVRFNVFARPTPAGEEARGE